MSGYAGVRDEVVGYCAVWDQRGAPSTGNFVNVITSQLARLSAESGLALDVLIQFCSPAFRAIFGIPPIPPVTPVTPPVGEIIIIGPPEEPQRPFRAPNPTAPAPVT